MTPSPLSGLLTSSKTFSNTLATLISRPKWSSISFPHKHPSHLIFLCARESTLCYRNNPSQRALTTKVSRHQHLIFADMHLSFYAAAALAAGGLQARALPTSDRPSIDLESPDEAGLNTLDERAIDWWPATNCVRHSSDPRINPPASTD
jgi:hypothetical protein